MKVKPDHYEFKCFYIIGEIESGMAFMIKYQKEMNELGDKNES